MAPTKVKPPGPPKLLTVRSFVILAAAIIVGWAAGAAALDSLDADTAYGLLVAIGVGFTAGVGTVAGHDHLIE